MKEPLLRTENLQRQVKDKRIVDNINISVYPKEVLAVVGPSGAGKSSLLRLLNRLDEPTQGTVYLHGQDYRRIPPRELRRRVGMVMQFPYLFPGTVADNIRFGPRQRGIELSDEEVEALLERVGLAGYGPRDVSHLSGGEAQRVSLARTLANRPEVLLLDEPTSALDEVAKAGIEALLREILSRGEFAAILVTHDLDQAGRLANRVALMEEGRITRMGEAEEVLRAYQALS
ncbi:MAG: phosphate ABC transporter ATP-binding protein [Chloroflexi bacterium]|nr:phosphate ABC transporter ATP-binding protein [Chloroflexota bacterium]